MRICGAHTQCRTASVTHGPLTMVETRSNTVDSRFLVSRSFLFDSPWFIFQRETIFRGGCHMESKSPARGRSRTPKPATGRRASSKGKHVTTKAHASPAPSASPSPAPRRRSAVRRAATPHVKLEDAVPASPTSPTPQKCARGTARGLWRCTILFWHWICTRVVLVGAAVVILAHPPSTLTVRGCVFFWGKVVCFSNARRERTFGHTHHTSPLPPP